MGGGSFSSNVLKTMGIFKHSQKSVYDSYIVLCKETSFHLYADDIQIYRDFAITDLPSTVNLINLEIQTIVDWTYRYGLKLNESKQLPSPPLGYVPECARFAVKRLLDFEGEIVNAV